MSRIEDMDKQSRIKGAPIRLSAADTVAAQRIRIAELEAELAEAKQQLDDIRNLGSIPAEEVAKYYLDHERNDGFSQARLTSVIERARTDGANEFRNEVQRLRDAIKHAIRILQFTAGSNEVLMDLQEALNTTEVNDESV